MNQMVTANSSSVTVTGNNENFQGRVSQFNTGCYGESSAVSRVNSVKIKITGSTARAANAGNNSYIIFVQTKFINSFNDTAGYYTIATAGAPDVRQTARTEIFID